VKIGPWELGIVKGGGCSLDGGAMFGTVPKVVWNKVYPCDGENRIALAANCLLLQGEVEGKRHVVLVENGNGDKEDDGWRQRFAMGPRGALEEGLAAHGLGPGDVTLCILTHLHFDHAGGSTVLDGSGRAVPAFPNARYVVQRQDLEDARAPHLRVKASYLPWNWEPLEAAGQLDTVEGETELLPGLKVRPAPGHIQGLQNVVVEGEDGKVVFLSDLIPTARHIQPAWVMGYDLDVVTCVDERIKVLDEVAGTGTVCVFYHDPEIPAGRVQRDAKGRYAVVPVAI
jgi:glyoxylase-like metal-dependent hydrolase (beta-lactamase superfamily II)